VGWFGRDWLDECHPVCGLEIMNRRCGASVLGWVLVRDEFELAEAWSAGGLQSLWDLVSDHGVDHRAGAAPEQGCEWQFDKDGSGETEPPPMSAPRQHDVEPGVAGKQRPSDQCGWNGKLARPVHGP
jgi:hypothetical protein